MNEKNVNTMIKFYYLKSAPLLCEFLLIFFYEKYIVLSSVYSYCVVINIMILGLMPSFNHFRDPSCRPISMNKDIHFKVGLPDENLVE